MMFHVKLMKNQMLVLIGQIHGDFKVTASNFGQVYSLTQCDYAQDWAQHFFGR